MPKTTLGYGYSPQAISEQVTVMRPVAQAPDGTAKAIVFLHGVTGGAADVMNNSGGLFNHCAALTQAGFVVVAADFGGAQNWSGPAAMNRWNDIVALIRGTTIVGSMDPVGCSPTAKIGVMAGSMGGAVALNLMKRYSSAIAGALLWNPVTDLRWAGQEAGYTPAYVTGGLVGQWSGGVAAAYPLSTTATGGLTLNQAGQTVPIAADPGFTASGTVTIAGTTVTYTGKTANSLTGCTVASGTLTVASGYLVTQGAGSYANTVGYRIVDEYATWKGKTIKVIHASDDATVPNQASAAFVAGVNDPKVTFRTPQPTGGHLNVFANVPTAETVQFFTGLSY